MSERADISNRGPETGSFFQRDRTWHPPAFTPGYKTSVLRSPQKALLSLDNTISEITGPVFGHNMLGELDDDMIFNFAKPGESAIGQRIIVYGRVLDERGKGVSGALVEVWQANAGGRYRHKKETYLAPLDPNFGGCGRAITDEDGNYSTDPGHPLFSGPTDLHADAPGYFPFDLEFFLETGDNVLDFSMEPFEGNGQSASLSGTVSDAGSGMPLAHVCLSAPGFMGQPVTAESDSLGHFLLEGLHGGSSELMAAALGYHTLFMPLLLQPGDNSLDLFLNARDDGEPHDPVILGRVLDMFSHDPIGDAELLLQAGDQQWLGLSDEDGHFAFGPLAVDAPFATLSANADGYSEAQLELNLHGMGHHAPDTLRVNIEMMSLDNGMLLGLLAGNVRTEDTGLPVYAMVEAISAEPGDPLSFHTFTNSSGHWSLDLPAGAWFVRCHVLSGGNGAPVDYTEYWEDAQSLDAATVIDLAPAMVRDGMNSGIPRVDGGQITIQRAARVSDADMQGSPGMALRF